MYQLSQNEDKQEKLFVELKKALSEKDSRITPETLDQLPYLKACIKETLRMYPVVLGNGRSLQSDAVISGYNVPKGVSAVVVVDVHQSSSHDRKFKFDFVLPLADSCDFPALRAVEQGKLLPGTVKVHSRAMAEERGTVAEGHSSVRQPAFWLRSQDVHRQTLRWSGTCHFVIQSKLYGSINVYELFLHRKLLLHRFSASTKWSTITARWATESAQLTFPTSHWSSSLRNALLKKLNFHIILSFFSISRLCLSLS